MENVVLWFRLNSNMLAISFVMGMFSYQNKSQCLVGTLIFDVFRRFFHYLPYLLV